MDFAISLNGIRSNSKRKIRGSNHGLQIFLVTLSKLAKPIPDAFEHSIFIEPKNATFPPKCRA